MQELIGQTLGQYKIVEQIGQGGMATVFKARQPGLERWVAVKVLPPTYAADLHFREHFLREARAIAQLEHPHILPVYDFGQQGPYIYLVMRYVEGSRSLADVMRAPLSLTQMLTYLDQVAAALDYAHGRGIIHRDVKPTNILLSQEWVFLADFGLARLLEATAALIITDVASGTPAYMSPEQGSGAKVNARTDVYALGVIVYEMLTGQIPHVAEATQAIIYKRTHEPAPSVRTSRSDIPPQIDQIVQTALAPNPVKRFQSTGAFVAALRRVTQESNAGQLMTSPAPARWIEPAPVPWSPPAPLPLPAQEGALAAVPNEPVASSGNPPWLGWLAGSLAVLIIIALLTGGITWFIVRPSSAEQPVDEFGAGTETVAPSPLTPTPNTPGIEVLFADEFDGVGLDSSKWTFLMGGGQIQVYNSVLRLTSAGQTFPLIYPTANPFPDEGNFRVKVSMRYFSAAERSTGFRIGTTAAAYGAVQSRAELLGERLIEIGQDSNEWRIVVGEQGAEVYTLAAPDLNLHELEIAYIDHVYQISLDGEAIYASEPTTVRPTFLWFGNPAEAETGGEWSGLEIERVSVEALPGSSGSSPTPTPVPPTIIPTLTPTILAQNCTSSASDVFAEVWPAYRPLLGCPTGEFQTLSTIAEETFQGGHLFWIKDTEQVYIILDREKNGGELTEGQWRLAEPSWKWDGSNPEGVGLAPPVGLVEPKRGFGWLWRTHLGGPEGPLGWALDKEYGFDNTGKAQVFERGVMFKGSLPKIYVLLNDGNFYAKLME